MNTDETSKNIFMFIALFMENKYFLRNHVKSSGYEYFSPRELSLFLAPTVYVHLPGSKVLTS